MRILGSRAILIAFVLLAFAAAAQAKVIDADPAGYESDLNFHTFVGNDPANHTDPSGKICIPGVNGSSPYCGREGFYSKANADPAIGGKTDYFKAVGAMTDNLANMDLPGARANAGIDDKTYNALDKLSQGIEDFNKGQIARLRSGEITGSRDQINRRLVSDEQKFITKQLGTMRQSDPSLYMSVISTMNRNANIDLSSRTGIELSIANPGIMGAAQMTRSQLGRNIDFSNEADRTLMGNNMISVYTGE
jgi:hypothetical protein